MIASSTDVAAVWSRWHAWHREQDRATLVDIYAGFVRILAAKCYAARVSRELDFEDYLQFGMVGLLESIERFNPELTVKFETFAGYRIRGAILDGVESLSELQCQIATRNKLIKERSSSISSQGGGDVLERFSDVAIGLALGFILEYGEHSSSVKEVTVPDNCYSRIELRELRQQVRAMIDLLPSQERDVIYRHYFQQVPFEQIATSMSLSKGRISQLHKAALNNIRALRKAKFEFEVQV